MAVTRRALLGNAALGLGAAVTPVLAAPADPPRIERRRDGARLHFPDEVVDIHLAHAGVATVIKAPPQRLPGAAGFFPAKGTPATFEDTADRLTLVGRDIRVEIAKADGRLKFTDGEGRERIAEAAMPAPLPGVKTTRRQAFTIGASEALLGLGQFREPLAEYRNRDVFLAHANSDAVIPLLATTGGWGLLWDTDTAAHFRSRGTRLEYHSVGGNVIRYHVCIGDGLEGVVRRYRTLTGAASLLPRWAYGYWQSKERYNTQAELTGAVDEYRRRKLPIDAVVLDWRYWGENDRFSGMTFDRKNFPDPRGMVDHVHARDVHLLASIWPAFGPNTGISREMAAGGHLFPGKHWSGGRVFDVSKPAARAIYWKHIKRGLIDIGVDGLWTDGNEPEFQSTGDRYGTAASFAENGRMAAGPIVEHLLTYSFVQARGLSSAMRRDTPAKRPVILSRSAYAGQQAFGAVTWSGDIFASWGTLTNQIVAAQQFSLAGSPWWTCDIGGFLVFHRYPDGLDDPAYRELYVRWFQFGAFLPIFRAHGTHVPRELWRFGEPGTPFYDALEAALRQRYALMPYIYSTAAAVAFDGDCFLRPLSMDYPGDAATAEPAAFMAGRDLLVRVVDRPLFHGAANIQEFLPNYAVVGDKAPAASVTFFEGASFERQIATRLTDDVKMTWSGDLPPELAGKPYSTRWTGRIVAQETGGHRFSVMGKGAMRMILDGREVVDGVAAPAIADGATGAVAFKEHAGDARFTFDAVLDAGRSYAFTLEQRQQAPDVVSLWLEWITPSHRARMAIPPTKTIATRLPAGHDWYDFATGERHRGGTTVCYGAPLGSHPVFARAGAIIPMSPGIDRTAGLPETLTIRVYAGRDGAFTLFDDAGDGEGHLNGEATRMPLRWIDTTGVLEIGPRNGSFPGMRESVALRIELIAGREIRKTRLVQYDGQHSLIHMN